MAKRKKKIRRRKIKRTDTRLSSIITPSTQLQTIGVHKLQDYMTCDRLFFWKWVMNIIPRKLNIAFWFGSIAHRGLELFVQGKSIKFIEKALRKYSIEYLKPYEVDMVMRPEVEIQLEIVILMVKTYLKLYGKKQLKFIITNTEVRFAVELSQCPVLFIGVIDSYGKKGINYLMPEYKTAGRIDSEYFKRLVFDKQLNGYAIGLRDIVGKFPKESPYIVLRKPSIRVKQTETTDEFLERLEEDLHKRRDWYFIHERFTFGKRNVEAVFQDIEIKTRDLWLKYDCLDDEELLNPMSWARNDRACFNYGVCPYFMLCKNCHNYPLYLKFYMMREIRYEEEKAELNHKLRYSTVRKGKLAMRKG